MATLQIGLLVALVLSAIYVFILMVQKMLPEKKHKYTGGVDSDGRYSGLGKLIAVNGDVYTGEFKAGVFHGRGTYLFKKGGGSYTGEFREGLFAGQGKELYPDGSQYVGGFDNSKRSGQGTMTYSNGAVFTGSWRAGKKEGPGIFKYSDGTRFEGRFSDGKREGVGFIYDKKNRKLQGQWKGGKLAGGKLTRVLHKTGSPDPTQENGLSPDTEEESERVTTPIRLRLRGSSSSSQHGTPTPTTSRAHPSSTSSTPSLSSRRPLSSQKEKELTNQLLNFSKKIATQSAGMGLTSQHYGQSGGAMLTSDFLPSRQERERSQLIAELARAHSFSRASGTPVNGAGGAATTSTSSSSSQSLAQSTHASPLHTPSRRSHNGDDSRFEPALEDVCSSGLESAGGGAAGSGSGEGEESAGEDPKDWQASQDPTHVSNAGSMAPTPTLNTAQRNHLSPAPGSPKVHPASPKVLSPQQKARRTHQRPTQLASDESEKKPEGAAFAPGKQEQKQPI